MTDAIQYIRCNWCAAFVTTEGITALLAHRDAAHPKAVARVVSSAPTVIKADRAELLREYHRGFKAGRKMTFDGVVDKLRDRGLITGEAS